MKRSKEIRLKLKSNIAIVIAMMVVLVGICMSRNTLAIEDEGNNTGKVIVHYVDKFTDEEIKNNVIEGKIGDRIKTSPESIENYDLVGSPEESNYTITEEDQHVYYYYLYNCKIIVRHVDEISGNGVGAESHSGLEGESFTSHPIEDIIYYKLVKKPETEEYKFSKETQTIYYYYRHVGQVIVHHVDSLTGKELDTEHFDGLEGNSITTKSKDIENYKLCDDTLEKEVKFTKKGTHVYYYYKHVGHVTVHYIDSLTGEELDTEYFEGLEGDRIITKAKDIESYKLCDDTLEKEAEFTQNGTDVYYYYTHISGGIIVKYIDIISNEIIEEQFFDGIEGQKYNFYPKEFPRYSFVKSTENTSGFMGRDATEIRFYYVYNSKIKIRHVYGTDGGEDVETIFGNEGEYYSTSPKNNPTGYDGRAYELDKSRIPTNSSGTFSKYDDEIVYYYIPQKGSVIVKYIDKATGKYIVDPDIITGYTGESYRVNKKEFLDYVLVEETENKDGIFDNGLKEIIFYYLKKCYITVNYIDDKTGEILDTEQIEGLETREFSVLPKEFKHYRLIENKNPRTNGVFTSAPITLNFYYSRQSFNISVSHNIEKIVINGKETKVNGVLGKVEINSKINKYDINIYYKITVSNNMGIEGSTLLVDYIPAGFIALLKNNPNWKINGNIATIYVENLAPGESREYTLILTNTNKSIKGIVSNKVAIENPTGDSFFEDNISSSNMIIGVSTGTEKDNKIAEAIAVIILFLILICEIGNRI